MRVWDISPGYLDRQGLLGEHNEIHALVSVMRGGRRGYARHPETMRWRGRLGALARRHALVVDEMELRGYKHASAVPLRGGRAWPETFVDEPARQLRLVRAKLAARGTQGRMPIPRNAHELWAQHKYSVMARDPEAYRAIGRRVAAMRAGPPPDDLVRELALYLRLPATPGRLRNAIEHVWGYVAGASTLQRPGTDVRAMLAEARRLAAEVPYLLHSTALSDLHCEVEHGTQS